MSKSPAFQLYAQDFLVDTMQWDIAMIGLHIRLLCQQWVNNGIDSDPKGVPIGLSKKQKTVFELIRHKYVFTDNKLFNERLEKIRDEQEENRKNQSEKGKKGANVRWGKHGNTHNPSNGTGIAQAMANGVPKNSSSSSTSSSIYYINIGIEKFFKSPSQFLQEKDQLFFEQRMMTVFSGLDKKEILGRFDDQYNMYNFHDINHFRNAFKKVGEDIKMENNKKTYRKNNVEVPVASENKKFDLKLLNDGNT